MLCLVCLAQFMVILDATIVNVALPSIQKDLGISESSLQWIVNAYALMFGGFLLLGGRAGDLIGRKRVFVAGLVLFTTASLLCALAPNETWLIVSRGVQGLGAALVSPAALSIVTTTFAEGAERTKALGVWAAIAVGGGAVGLVLGGILVETLSWPWIFFVNVPVGIVAFLLSRAVRAGVEGRAPAPELRPRGRGDRDRRSRLARLRDRALRRVGLGVGRGDRLPRPRGRAARRLRLDREPLGRAARPALDLLRQDRPGCERRDVRRRRGPVRDVLLQHAVRPAGARLLAARSRLRVRPLHGGRDRRRGALAETRTGARRPRGAGDRRRARGARAVAVPAADARQLLRDRPAARSAAHVGGDGARVRPDHADRDERAARRRRGARLRSLQHVPADRRRSRPGRALDPRRRRARRTS